MSTSSKIAKLQEMGIIYAKKIEIESRRCVYKISYIKLIILCLQRDLERELQNVQEVIKSKRSELIELEGNDTDSIGKMIKKYENKLEKILNENNEVSAKNKQLKEEINILRKERVIFDKVYNQLEIELKAKESELNDVILKAEVVKGDRQKAQDQIDNLKKVVTQEKKKIEEEYKLFFSNMDHEATLKRGGGLQDSRHHNQSIKMTLNDESKLFVCKFEI